jgi:hypothetical protein
MLSTPPTSANDAGRSLHDSSGFEHADHAGAALHDGGEGRHVRIEFGVEPDLAGQISVGEIADHRAPDAEIDRSGNTRCHRLYHGHRQRQRVATRERSVDAGKGRANARG